MKPIRLVFACLLATGATAPVSAAPAATTAAVNATEQQRWTRTAARVTIVRDKWGVAHVFGQTDADAVFGMLYAQAEDDFNRIELNYINALGRLAEVEGEGELYRDLRMKLFINPAGLRRQYDTSPPWLKALMNAFADGLNYYLHTHPQVKPKLLTHFEPWMALAFSEGSIGGDIESVSLAQLEQFYGRNPAPPPPVALRDPEPRGSNGFAIAPQLSASGRAMLLINPHTSFYFRPEIHMVSRQGLNAYGASTWGQFFIYQGFNDRLGWMHTSGGGDVIDEFIETVAQRAGKLQYKHGDQWRDVKVVPTVLPYKTASGMARKTVNAYFTHHGPIVRALDGKWVAVSLMNTPQKALMQSYLRTKARNYNEFYRVMQLRTNSSNNTVYADADGNIAYFHGNFVPRREPRFDWKHPVDGSDPATDWRGLHAVDETIMLKNPANGWLQNTNNWPFSAAGKYSPQQSKYPAYMWANPENARGVHAVKVLEGQKAMTLDTLIAAAHDSYLTAFDTLIPPLLAAYDALPQGDAQRAALAPQIAALRGWDRRYSVASIETSLAIYWGQDLLEHAGPAARAKEVPAIDFIATGVAPAEYLAALARASAKLTNDFGQWNTPWGEINRFQRLTGDIKQPYDDAKPSLPVASTSSVWGSLAAFGATGKQTTRRIYGDRGNSFVAAVEFGPRIRARSVLAGGVSGDPASKHFADQAEMYSKGQFKEVLFYREDIDKHAERTYRPGQPGR
ncbi:MAG TPA: penicillin acylase family protein [Burkholderiaceae bacterium]